MKIHRKLPKQLEIFQEGIKKTNKKNSKKKLEYATGLFEYFQVGGLER